MREQDYAVNSSVQAEQLEVSRVLRNTYGLLALTLAFSGVMAFVAQQLLIDQRDDLEGVDRTHLDRHCRPPALDQPEVIMRVPKLNLKRLVVLAAMAVEAE